MAFNAYLNFPGTCRDAFTAYQQIFGGELHITATSDVQPENAAPPQHVDLVVHAALTLPDGAVLMASDAPTGDFGTVQGMYVAFQTDDPSEAERVFGALAEDGNVEMPIAETFFAARFGVCRDRFGTPWMVTGGAHEVQPQG